jgi:phosphate transport system protein
MTQSTQTVFDREYGRICDEVVSLGKSVDEAIGLAMQALTGRDIPLAQSIVANDDAINKLRYKIEEECLTLIATQQPIAGDLRAVMAAMHIVVEVERMGDYAAGIAKIVIRMSEEPLLKTFKKIPKMGELGRKMLEEILQAFVNRDANWATEIAAQDDEMDQMYQATFDRLVETMAHKPEMIKRMTYLMWCAHDLERIGDRVTNVAERILFMTTGDLRELGTG